MPRHEAARQLLPADQATRESHAPHGSASVDRTARLDVQHGPPLGPPLGGGWILVASEVARQPPTLSDATLGRFVYRTLVHRKLLR